MSKVSKAVVRTAVPEAIEPCRARIWYKKSAGLPEGWHKLLVLSTVSGFRHVPISSLVSVLQRSNLQMHSRR